MVQLMGRSRAFAEAVVTMVCPVLLALALNKWKGEVEGHVVPAAMLASATIITGTFPLLACCIANSKRFATACEGWPAATSNLAAPCSAIFLVILACWIALFIVSRDFVMDIACLFALIMATRISMYRGECNVVQDAQRTPEFCTVLDGSHEFLSGATGILFLGLEGLALGGLINTRHEIWETMGSTSILFCAVGVFLMCLQMTPPPELTTIDQIAMFTFMSDAIMAFGTVAVLIAIMWELMKFKGLMFAVIPAIEFTVFVIKVACQGDEEGIQNHQADEPKLAPLGLTKVIFTGFTAISISDDSPNEWTNWFLISAAAAIVSGILWRLMTQVHVKKTLEDPNLDNSAVASCANLASFFTHFCIIIATVLFVAGIYGRDHTRATAPVPAPAPYSSK